MPELRYGDDGHLDMTQFDDHVLEDDGHNIERDVAHALRNQLPPGAPGLPSMDSLGVSHGKSLRERALERVTAAVSSLLGPRARVLVELPVERAVARGASLQTARGTALVSPAARDLVGDVGVLLVLQHGQLTVRLTRRMTGDSSEDLWLGIDRVDDAVLVPAVSQGENEYIARVEDVDELPDAIFIVVVTPTLMNDPSPPDGE
jgi:hypothetical protein